MSIEPDAAAGLRHVFVRGLTVQARLGVHAHEKAQSQRVVIGVDLAVRDPEKGDHTILLQTQGVAAADGKITLNNNTTAFILDNNGKLKNNLPEDCLDIAKESANNIIKNLSLDDPKDDFTNENANKYTYVATVGAPGPKQ